MSAFAFSTSCARSSAVMGFIGFGIDPNHVLGTGNDAFFNGRDARAGPDQAVAVKAPVAEFLFELIASQVGTNNRADDGFRRPAPARSARRFPAPPSRRSRRSTVTTGTGASGEIALYPAPRT